MPEILAVTDFTDAASNAIHYAAKLAQDMGYGLRLLHTYMVPIATGEPAYPLIAVDELEAIANERMTTILADVQSAVPGLAVQHRIAYGDWQDAVTDNEEEASCPLIVLGRSADDDDFWMGRAAMDAARHMERAILVVPEGIPYQKPRVICIACDTTILQELAPVKAALPVFKALGTTIQFLHVQADASSTAQWDETALSAALNEVPVSCFQISAEHESIDKIIHDFAVAHYADILAMLPHHYSLFQGLFHKSHTRAAFRAADIPVLSLH